jgi:hypothetical protein
MRIVYAPTRDTWKRVSSADEAGFVACLRRGGPFAVRVRGIRGISGDRRDVFCYFVRDGAFRIVAVNVPHHVTQGDEVPECT